VKSGDVSSLINHLNSLAHRPKAIRLAGRRARKAFERNYDLRHGVARITRLIYGDTHCPATVAPSTSAAA